MVGYHTRIFLSFAISPVIAFGTPRAKQTNVVSARVQPQKGVCSIIERGRSSQAYFISPFVSFQNLYTETAYVALLWFDPGCNPDPWRKSGWYAVPRNRWVEFDKC
jgi:hypothetical protein